MSGVKKIVRKATGADDQKKAEEAARRAEAERLSSMETQRRLTEQELLERRRLAGQEQAGSLRAMRRNGLLGGAQTIAPPASSLGSTEV
jgi:hypothetical protein